ncbi:MAG: molybdate ABC transporter permease subunit [Armatimonadetes bacterium]|nr:molybdate ABC transporter permease subunit [Anaerolineae bacterium]
MFNFRRVSPGYAVMVFASLGALVFLCLPIAALLVRSVTQRAWENDLSAAVADAIWLSAWTTLTSLLLTLSFGTPLAYLLARRRFALRALVTVLVELPIVLPPAVAGLALLLAFGRRGIIGAPLYDLGISVSFTVSAVIMAQTFVAAPFYIRSAQVGFQSVPKEIEEAAQVDGASGLSLFWFITLPLCSRALAAGLVLCWARALGEFGATMLFAGSLQGRTQTMPLLIYNNFQRDLNAAIWTGLLLVMLAMLALLLSRWLSQSRDDAPTMPLL